MSQSLAGIYDGLAACASCNDIALRAGRLDCFDSRRLMIAPFAAWPLHLSLGQGPK